MEDNIKSDKDGRISRIKTIFEKRENPSLANSSTLQSYTSSSNKIGEKVKIYASTLDECMLMINL